MPKKDKSKKKSRVEETIDLPDSIKERFDTSKPQFRPLKEEKEKFVVDERFASVLDDPRFQVTSSRDKYGRKQKKKKNDKAMNDFYVVEKEQGQEEHNKSSNDSKSDQESEASSDPVEEEGPQDPETRIAYLTAFARGELDVLSSSSDSEGDDASGASDVSVDEDNVEGRSGILDPSTAFLRQEDEGAEMLYEKTPYLVVANMDWSHIKSVDIFAICSSFVPPGAVQEVTVYQSNFGMQRMAEEEKFGPRGVWKEQKKTADKSSNSDGDDNSAEGSVEEEQLDTDFDPEKLREYEALKLKYYFAIVQFSSPEFADVAYKEVDGMEFEHSSAAVDMRAVVPEDVVSVVKDRPVRDSATAIPSNYSPPDFVVSALQQSNVKCTWEDGDYDRDRKLTKYSSGQIWNELAETDDLKAYLASDNSSEDDDSDNEGRGDRLRKMLGLDSDDDDVDSAGVGSRSDKEEEEAMHEREIEFVPGKADLEAKIRSKLENKDEKPRELTPWEKYQEKRRQKKREKRQAARTKRSEVKLAREQGLDQKPPSRKENGNSFFIGEGDDKSGDESAHEKETLSRAELELLVAGDDQEEDARDYDMRGLQRLQKTKGKKLRGSRKRKEEALAAEVAGTDFKVDVSDDRFKAVLDGSDERFGIDRQDPSFRETAGMKDLLSEQTRRRKKKRRKDGDEKSTGANRSAGADVEFVAEESGAAALSSLVSRLKQRVGQ